MNTLRSPERILMTGATGLVGRELALELFSRGHSLSVVSRSPANASEAMGIPVQAYAWNNLESAVRGADVIIHLAGEPVSAGRWTQDRRRRILESRVDTTDQLVAAIQTVHLKTGHKPRALISASATGFYGNRGDEILSESSARGEGFLSDVCREWEAAATRAEELAGVSTLIIRFGVVLSHEGPQRAGGGALEKMLPAFRAGVAGKMGTGTQWMSWIHIRDLVNLLVWGMNHPLTGVLNGVAPMPITNREFTHTLAKTLRRPALLPVPALALKTAFGKMSSVILEGQRVHPVRALKEGFKFRFPDLAGALTDLVGRNGATRVFTASQFLPRGIDEVFHFFSQEKNLEILTPPWVGFKVISVVHPSGPAARSIEAGSEISYRLNIHGLPIRWKTRITEWKPGQKFADFQLKGPYSLWDHQHEFFSVPGGTVMRDRVEYLLPFWIPGDLIAGQWVARDVRKIFEFRSQQIQKLFGEKNPA